MIMSRHRLALLPCVLLLVTGCGSSPKRNFYALPTPPPARESGGAPARPVVEIGALTLPELVDRAQIVARQSDTRLEISDAHRWAEPLKSAIATTLAAYLSRELGGAPVYVQGQSTAREPDLRLSLDMLRFESVLHEAALVEAVWMLRRKEEDRPIRGRSVVRETVQGEGYEALVAAHGRALSRLAHEIAMAIRAGS